MILLVTGGFVTTAHLSCIGEHYSTTVTICRLPSPNRGVEKDFWVMDFPFYTNILAFCPAQNLIASAKEDGYVDVCMKAAFYVDICIIL